MKMYFEDYEENIAEIVENFEKNIKENNTRYFDVEDYLLLIEHYMSSSNSKKARVALDTALSQHPSSLDLQLKEAELLSMDNKQVEALAIIKKLEPLRNDTDVFLLKGIVFNALNKIQKADEAFQKAIMKEDDEDDMLDLYFKIGLSFQHILNFSKALKYHRKLFELSPIHKENIFELAYCYEQLEMFDDSVLFYNKYLDLNPYSEKAWYNLGIIYNKLYRYQEAVDAYDFTLAIHPENKDAIFNKGNAYFYLQQYDKSLSCYLKSLNFSDNHSLTHTYIGECYEKKGDYLNARLHYIKATEIDDSLSEAWFGLGMVAKLENHFGEAIYYMERSLKEDSSYAESYLELGKIYEIVGEKILALNSYKCAMLTSPSTLFYVLELAKFYHRERNVEGALEVLQNSASFFDENAEYLYYRALFYFLTEQKDSAVKSFEKATSLDKEEVDIVLNYCKENIELINQNKFNELQSFLK